MTTTTTVLVVIALPFVLFQLAKLVGFGFAKGVNKFQQRVSDGQDKASTRRT